LRAQRVVEKMLHRHEGCNAGARSMGEKKMAALHIFM